MMAVGLGRGKQREHGIVALPRQKIVEKRAQPRTVPIAAVGRRGIGGEAEVLLIEEVVLPDSQDLAGAHGFLLANRFEPGAAVAVMREAGAVEDFGQRGISIARLDRKSTRLN